MEKMQLTMLNYQVIKASFLLKEGLAARGASEPIDINPSFNRTIKKIDDDTISIDVSISVSGELIPFELFVKINGMFHLEKWESNDDKKFVAIENTTAILFPYLRQAVTTLTSLGGVAPLVLPVINTFDLFNRKPKSEKNNENAQ